MTTETKPAPNQAANRKRLRKQQEQRGQHQRGGQKKAMNNEFTPFDCLAVAETTRSGLLMCWEAEIEVCWVSNGELRCCTNSSRGEPPMVPLTRNDNDGTAVVDATKTKWIDRCADLDILVTTHRLAFVKTGSSGNSTNEPPPQPKHPPGGGGGGERIIRYIHHSNIFSLTTESSLFKSPKLILQCSIGELILAFPNGSDRTKRRDECHDQLKMALQRQQWETTSGGTHAPPTSGRRRVGVDAILTANTRRHQQAAQLTSTAFGGDAEQLLREAADLVHIIEKYVATLDRNTSNNNNPDDDDDGGGGGGGAYNQQLVQMMQGMGMTSALHRDDQLARQLADFLRPKFQHHPVITLTDVYCWFNRARGFSQLLSPDELLTAITSMEALRLGISRQTFESGLVVLRPDDDDDPQQGGSSDHEAVLHRRFLDMCAQQSRAPHNPHVGCVTAVQVAQANQVPAVLAMEQLQWAERQGVLVRDETVESIRFYPNRFNDW